MKLHASKLKVPQFPIPPAEVSTPVANTSDHRFHPLKRHTLRGSSSHLALIAIEQKPLLDKVCWAGQLTVWFGPPGAGKTLTTLKLTIDAVEAGRIDPENVIYINVDDTLAGMAQKVSLCEERNIHVLGEGLNNFSASKFVKLLQDTITEHKASGLFIILDTLKKFSSLMDKKESSSFNTLCRQFAAAGGTMLCLAHTNKRTGPNGELIHAGTSDVREDFDAAYILTPRDDDSTAEKQIVEFRKIKGRGGGDDRVLFSYDRSSETPYDERLMSVTKLDPSGFAPLLPSADARRLQIIEAIETRIRAGDVQKMDLAKEVGEETGVGRHSVTKIINELTGTDPNVHRWTFVVRQRGAKFYRLLTQSGEGPEPAAAADAA